MVLRRMSIRSRLKAQLGAGRLPVRAGSCVRESTRFARRELSPVRSTSRYTLRESGIEIYLRQPLQDSWIVDEVFKRRVYEMPAPARAALDSLGRAPRIVDVGGHVGLSSAYLLGLIPEASVVTFEPDPEQARMIERTIEANGRAASWSVVNAFAAPAAGTVDFISDGHGSRLADGTAASISVQAVDVFPYLGDADLLKMDIQGAEWPLVMDDRFRDLPAAAMVVEYHPYLCPSDDPLGLLSGVLAESGYSVDAPTDVHLGEGTLWAWRTTH
jgi:FkbM family methyltransferase